MNGHHAVLINNRQEAGYFLEQMGSNPEGIEALIPRAVFKCIKLKNIPDQAVLAIKQEMLAQGGSAVIADTAPDIEGSRDIMLMGTLYHYRLLLEKIKQPSAGLSMLAGEIGSILAALEIKAWKIPLAHGGSLTIGRNTKIMGILNVTPDSFSDGGRFFDTGRALEHALAMAEAGADIIDVGGASSRPGSTIADEYEEMQRILPVIKRLAATDLTISVDTFRARVAEAALDHGAHLINDIGGFEMDPDLLEVVARWQAPVILMHNRMQIRPGEAYQDLVADIILDLQQSISQAVNAGLSREHIIIDPGLGFGKTRAENLQLVNRLQDFRSLGRPILLGASRKNFIGRTLELETGERLEGSLAVAVIGIINGANLVRVHDVRETKRAAVMADAVRLSNG